MKFSKKNVQDTGYHYPDAILAIRQISKDKNVTQAELATRCKMSVSHFRSCLGEVIQHTPRDNLYIDINDSFLGDFANYSSSGTYSGTYNTKFRFKERDLANCASALGKKCGGAFTTVPSMIAYAQKNCTLPASEHWVRTDYPDEQSVALAKQGIAKLPLYKAAANLCLGSLRLSCNKLMPNDDLANYLNDRSCRQTPATRFERMSTLAHRIGERLGVENMTPDSMVEYARAKWPEQIPAEDVLPAHKSGGYGGR